MATVSPCDLSITCGDDRDDAHGATHRQSSRSRPPIHCRDKSYGYHSHMEKASVSRLKNALSAYLRRVRAGQSVIIYDRDVPIARIERIEDSGSGSNRLALLDAQGITRPASGTLSVKRLRQSLSRPLPRSVRLLEALRAERAEDR